MVARMRTNISVAPGIYASLLISVITQELERIFPWPRGCIVDRRNQVTYYRRICLSKFRTPRPVTDGSRQIHLGGIAADACVPERNGREAFGARWSSMLFAQAGTCPHYFHSNDIHACETMSTGAKRVCFLQFGGTLIAPVVSGRRMHREKHPPERRNEFLNEVT